MEGEGERAQNKIWKSGHNVTRCRKNQQNRGSPLWTFPKMKTAVNQAI